MKAKYDHEEAMYVLQDRLTKQLIEQTFICQDMVCRRGVWLFIDNLRTPLTEPEIEHIAEIKAKCVPCTIPILGATF